MKRRALIAGCGYVGRATGRLLHARGWEVVGITHSAESAAAAAGEPLAVEACDFTNRDALSARDSWRDLEAIVHCGSSGRGGADAYRSVYLDGVRCLAEALRPQRLVFTSSTSVYAQTDGSYVDESSAANPDRETGRILREAEEITLAQGGIVARIAGIYGPGRSVLLRRFFSGDAIIEGDGGRFVNQAHRDDIAAALVALLTTGVTGIFNVADDEPLTQRAIYEWLAAHFGKPLPPTGPLEPDRKRGWTNKRVSNAKLRALGWEPRYHSFREAVLHDPALLTALSPASP